MPTSSDVTSEPSRPKSHKKSIVVLAVLCAAAMGCAVFFFFQYQGALQNTQAKQQQQLLERLGATVILPTETPLFLSISDKSKLSNTTLAARVDNGDTLIVYSQAKRLIVYRPAAQKIVDMLSIDSVPQLNR
jgi:hypothetical protein